MKILFQFQQQISISGALRYHANAPYVDFRNQIGKLYEQWQPYQLSKSTNNLAVG